MMSKIIAVAILFFLFACGTTYKQQVQAEGQTYLQLIGELKGEKLILDDAAAITLDDNLESFDLGGRTATKIRIDKGKHTLKILRNGKVIVNRVFYVSSGNTFEVEIP